MIRFIKDYGSKAFIAWLTLGILWGATFVGANIGVQHLPALLMGGTRFFIAAITALFLSLPQNAWRNIKKRQILHSALMGGLMFGISNGFISVAQVWVSSSLTAIILATPPIMVALIDSYLPGGIRLSCKGWAGLLTSFGAIFWMWLPHMDMAGIGWFPLILLLLASFFWALGMLAGRHLPRIPNAWADISIQCFTAAAMQIGVGSCLGMWAHWHSNLPGWLAILFLALIGTVIGNYCLVYILGRMPPAKVMTYAYVNPVAAMLLGVLLLREILAMRMIIAALIILAGVSLCQNAAVEVKKK